MVTYGEATVTADILGWLVGDDIDGSAGIIAPVQGTLGSAQDFDTLNIEQRAELRRGLAGDHAVHVHCD